MIVNKKELPPDIAIMTQMPWKMPRWKSFGARCGIESDTKKMKDMVTTTPLEWVYKLLSLALVFYRVDEQYACAYGKTLFYPIVERIAGFMQVYIAKDPIILFKTLVDFLESESGEITRNGNGGKEYKEVCSVLLKRYTSSWPRRNVIKGLTKYPELLEPFLTYGYISHYADCHFMCLIGYRWFSVKNFKNEQKKEPERYTWYPPTHPAIGFLEA